MLHLIRSAAIAAMLITLIGPIGARGQAASPQGPAPQTSAPPTSAPPTTAPTAQWLFSTDRSIDRVDRNIAFAELAVENVNAAVPTKPVTYLGVSLEPPTEPLRAQLQLQDNVGLLVTWVDDQGPARDVLAKHDIITRIDDQIVINPDQFEALVHMHKPGDALDIRLVRNARPMQVSVKLSEKSATATGLATWTVTGDKLFTTVDRGGPIYIFNSTTGKVIASAATQPANAATADGWVEAKLQDIKPDAPPDRATVARRLYLDVTGLAASEAQIKAFVDDKSPDAYEKLVQELLKNRPAVIQQSQYVLSDRVVTPSPRNVVMTDGTHRLKFDAEGGALLTIMDKTGAITFQGPVQRPDEWKALPQAARIELDAWLRTMDEWHQAVTQDANQPTEGNPK